MKIPEIRLHIPYAWKVEQSRRKVIEETQP